MAQKSLNQIRETFLKYFEKNEKEKKVAEKEEADKEAPPPKKH